jgi:glucose-6-phosphate isomerase
MLDDLTRSTAEDLLQRDIVNRIWHRDPRVWDPGEDSLSAAVQKAIANRLGWLDAPAGMKAQTENVVNVARAVKDEGFTTAYLLGMGGSSLCAEVLRDVYRAREGWLNLHVLDTTDETTLTAAAGRLDDAHTVFLVASKSGTTVEVSSMERFFASEVARRHPGGAEAGRRFIAITDPGTVLERHAGERAYRATFVNPANIGGRFSALSLFGLVPAALLGIDVDDLLDAGVTIAEGCRQSNLTNPGLTLGSFIGAAARAGRDKLTVVLPPSMHSLGLWVEQLIAESTGKQGTGALPVVDEPLGRPDEYGDDRAFVALATDEDAPDGDAVAALERAGHPVLHIDTRRAALGAEFFRWEFATAIAGAVLQVNPFDEPNVTEAKDRTKGLLQTYTETGRLPDEGGATTDAVRALLAALRPGDYVAFLSYLPPDAGVASVLGETRLALRRRNRVATTLGVGPRYLHSTGQYHKGGPDTGVFVLLTMDDPSETWVPGMPYSFAVLKQAQALGDLQALEAHGRRAVRVHIRRGENPAQVLADVFRRAMS